MSTEQYTTGTVLVTAASTFIYGTNTSWNNKTIHESHKFKVKLDGERSYTIATIVSATKIQLSTKYRGNTGRDKSYLIGRSFSPHRSYARLYQGDSYSGDIIRTQVIDRIDSDIGGIYNGTASLFGCRVVATSGLHYWDITVNATGQLCFAYNGTRQAYVATSTGTWIDI